MPLPMADNAAIRNLPTKPLNDSAWHRLMAYPLVQHWGKEAALILALLVTLSAPFLLKPKESVAPTKYDRRLVIISPHNEKIRDEFGAAFTKFWKEKRGEKIYVDWRVPGGTAEIAMFLRSEYAAAFQFYWENKLHKPWTNTEATSFGNGKLKLTPGSDGQLDAAQTARKTFLESNVSSGIDLFFGGGAYDFQTQANAGMLVASDASGKFGPTALFEKHPDWFQNGVISQSVSGEPIYDVAKRWVGCCISSQGVVFNRDVLKRLGLQKDLLQWTDLCDPRLAGQVALADPNKSGTVTKALEQIIQQQILLTWDELKKGPGKLQTEKEIEDEAVRAGWDRGLRLIQRICANSRYFTDSSTKIPLEVSQGDAAAGMCIDFYARSFEEQVRKPDGTTRVGFVSPLGGSSVGVDPVALMRGAPEPELATAFMEFVLSENGQKLWNYKVGAEGGPKQAALRRLPVRRDFYTEANRPLMTDPNALPYEAAKAFTYHPEWTASLFDVIRLLVKVSSIEPHQEQKRAWQMLIEKNFPPKATALFEDFKLAGYASALRMATDLNRKDKSLEMKMTRELSSLYRSQYERAYDLAKRGE